MKGKKLSKVLAILLAVVMIFTTLPLMVFASTETYTVSFGAPAIPMNVNTKVDLKTLKVEIVKGATAVSGADITWAADAQEGLTLDADNKTVEVTAAGNYKLTATVGETTKNVWVIAKTAEQDKFYLVNIPNLRDVIGEDYWRVFGNYNGTELTVADALSSRYILGGKLDDMNYIQIQHAVGDKKADGSSANVGATLVYVDEIFNDFSDYTVESYCTAKGLTATNSPGAGVGGRVVLNETGTAYTTAVLSYIRNNEQVSFCRPYDFNPAKPSWGNWGGFGTPSGSNTLWATDTEGFFTVKTVLEDLDIMVYLNRGAGAGDEEMLTSTSDHPYANQAVTAGYPCLTGFYQPARFANMYVYLNSNDMPATMTDEPDAPAPEADITIVSGVGTGTATVEAVVGSENTYTVTLTPAEGYKLKVGSLVINGDIAHEYDDTGCVYTFTTDDLDTTTIAVEYIQDNGQFNTAMLGATIPTDPTVKGIRFGARTDSIVRSTQDATKGLLNDTINVGGVEYPITDIGMILFPTQPLGDAELTVATDGVVRQSVTKIVGLTNDYADIAITLTDIPDTMVGVQITSRMYVAYTDTNGATQYVYSNAISKSYNDVVEAIAQ